MSPAHRGRFVDRPAASTDGVQNGENKQNEACAYASKLRIREIAGWTDVKKRGLIKKMQGSAGGAASVCRRPPGRFENKNMNTTLRVFQEGPPPREWVLFQRKEGTWGNQEGLQPPTPSERQRGSDQLRTNQKRCSKELVIPADSNPRAHWEDRGGVRTGKKGPGVRNPHPRITCQASAEAALCQRSRPPGLIPSSPGAGPRPMASSSVGSGRPGVLWARACLGLPACPLSPGWGSVETHTSQGKALLLSGVWRQRSSVFGLGTVHGTSGTSQTSAPTSPHATEGWESAVLATFSGLIFGIL